MPSFLTSFRSLTTFKVKPFSRQGSHLFSLCPRTLCSPVTEHVSLHVKSLSEIWHVRNRDAKNMHPFSWGDRSHKKKAKVHCFCYQKGVLYGGSYDINEKLAFVYNRVSFEKAECPPDDPVYSFCFLYFPRNVHFKLQVFSQMSLPSHFPL